MTVPDELGETVSALAAQLTGRAPDEFRAAAQSGAEWLAVLRQQLAQAGFGLVSIARPGSFSWPGHWIGIVDAPHHDGGVGVLLFGTPSAVIASPTAPELAGKGVEELSFRDGFAVVPFQPLAKEAPAAARALGEVVGIYVSKVKTGPMTPVQGAKALAGRGLEGDRYAAKSGTFTPASDRLRGYDLTVIESEVLDEVRLPDGSSLEAAESRRNVVTRGIDLNALVGRQLTIGSVRAIGRRLCEPCVHLQRLTRPGVVAALVHRGGLRADILTDGEIRIGDRIAPA